MWCFGCCFCQFTLKKMIFTTLSMTLGCCGMPFVSFSCCSCCECARAGTFSMLSQSWGSTVNVLPCKLCIRTAKIDSTISAKPRCRDHFCVATGRYCAQYARAYICVHRVHRYFSWALTRAAGIYLHVSWNQLAPAKIPMMRCTKIRLNFINATPWSSWHMKEYIGGPQMEML